MVQELLPLFGDGETIITDLLTCEKRGGMVYYFHAGFAVFVHAEGDDKSFRMFTSQMVVNGNCRQVDIVRAFGVTEISVKRSVKKYREGGSAAFYGERRQRGATVLTEEVRKEVQQLLSEGMPVKEISQRLKIKKDTLSKAIRSGRLTEFQKKTKSKPVLRVNGA